MPELVNISVGSLPGTRGLDGTTVWPFEEKKSRKVLRMSATVALGVIALDFTGGDKSGFTTAPQVPWTSAMLRTGTIGSPLKSFPPGGAVVDMKTSPLPLLKDPSLLKTDALVNGQWVAGASRFAVHDPANGNKLADVANLTAGDAEAAIH